MKPLVIASALSFFLLCSPFPAHSAGLDEPGQKPITLKSEIQRGQECILDIATVDAEAFATKAAALLRANRQNNTDSNGFLLGAYFTFGDCIAAYSQSPHFAEFNRGGKAHVCVGFACFQFRQALGLQKRMGLADEDLALALGISDDALKSKVASVLALPEAHAQQ